MIKDSILTLLRIFARQSWNARDVLRDSQLHNRRGRIAGMHVETRQDVTSIHEAG